MVIGIDASRAFVTERTGTEQYSYQLITHMLRLPASKKHHFVLFTRAEAKVPSELVGYSNVEIKTITLPYLWTQIGLAWATWQTPIDLLWVPAHTLPVLRKPDLKTVVTIHGLEYRWLPEYRNLLQRWYLPLSTYYAAFSSTRLIAVSQATKTDLCREVGIKPDKVEVILEGASFTEQVETSHSNQVYQKYGIEPKKYILFVGTIQPRKNIGGLIKAFAKFYQNNPDYRLVLAGGIGWQVESELRLPAKLQIPEAVIITGRVKNEVLRTLYQGAAVYVQPSWTEGFGLPVLEAMANSIPTIVSDGGALPEVVETAGVVVGLKNKPNEANFAMRLAEAIQQLVNDKKLASHLKSVGKKRVRRLSWDRCAEATLRVLVTG